MDHLTNVLFPGGVISPVHDGYKKSSLIPARHRLAMARLAVTNEAETESWVRVSDWETKQVSQCFIQLLPKLKTCCVEEI